MTRRQLLQLVGRTAGGAFMYHAMHSLGFAAESDFNGPPRLGGAKPGASVLILGAGLAGMTAAFELRKAGYRVELLEYNGRAGGRSWTIRGGDAFQELSGEVQRCHFKRGNYFNPGPWRIPYHHHGMLHYCRSFGIKLEPFIQDNQNAYLHGSGAFDGKPQRFRHIRCATTLRAKHLVAILGGCLFGLSSAQAQTPASVLSEADRLAREIEPRVIAWRRDIHEHPELGNREFRTSKLIADHLKQLRLEVHAGIAHTGVIGILRGDPKGPVVALRAEMDALPVAEQVQLPFASKVRSTFNGRDVGVMHACGHDAHMAILMGVAQILSQMRDRLPGTVKFIFQPAEEGPPLGETGGASLMVKEGVLENPVPGAIFGLHVFSSFPAGVIAYKPGAIMASSDGLRITIHGRQTHGAYPWNGVDPIVTAAEVIQGLQTVVSRQTDLTRSPAVVTVGTIHGGVRANIIPDDVVMEGTIRTLDDDVRHRVHDLVRHTATKIAESAGATADVNLYDGAPTTYNDPDLTARMAPTLQRVAGDGNFKLIPPTTTGEDFSFYQQKIPGLFFFLGITPQEMNPEQAASNHSPSFYVDESALIVGVRAMSQLALDYLNMHGADVRQ